MIDRWTRRVRIFRIRANWEVTYPADPTLLVEKDNRVKGFKAGVGMEPPPMCMTNVSKALSFGVFDSALLAQLASGAAGDRLAAVSAGTSRASFLLLFVVMVNTAFAGTELLIFPTARKRSFTLDTDQGRSLCGRGESLASGVGQTAATI